MASLVRRVPIQVINVHVNFVNSANFSRQLMNSYCFKTNSFPTQMRLASSVNENPPWKVNMLYDSECPLCMHEVRFLQKRDGKKLIKFTDICALDYDPEFNGNVSYEEGMKKIHAVLADGTVIRGLEVFEKVYDAVGLGWVYSFSKIPVMFRFGERVYDFWARKRMWLTGRPDLEEVFEERRKTLEHMRNSQKLDEKVCDAK